MYKNILKFPVYIYIYICYIFIHLVQILSNFNSCSTICVNSIFINILLLVHKMYLYIIYMYM